jgi:DNA-binding MarR family transcriptional regulator
MRLIGDNMLDRFEQFSYSISNTYRHITKIEREEMEKYGLRGSYAQYLLAMKRFPDGITSAKLCEICDRDKAAISRIVNEMEEKGLITRETDRSNHYRAKLVLTEAGHKATDYVCERAEKAVMAAGMGLSDEDRKIFYCALAIIEANLRRIVRDGIPERENRSTEA